MGTKRGGRLKKNNNFNFFLSSIPYNDNDSVPLICIAKYIDQFKITSSTIKRLYYLSTSLSDEINEIIIIYFLLRRIFI